MVDAPEILAVIGKVPHLSEFLNSLYNCQYKSFFVAFCKLRYIDNFSKLLHYCKIIMHYAFQKKIIMHCIRFWQCYGLWLFPAGLAEQIKLDRYLQPHFRYYMREVRTVVYSQFLESYKSVTMEAMAAAFGVTVDFIDQ